MATRATEELNNLDKIDHNAEIERQIGYLEGQICQSLCTLRISTSELAMMEKSNRDFLKDYFKNVGVLFEEIKKLDAEIASFDGKITLAKSALVIDNPEVAATEAETAEQEDEAGNEAMPAPAYLNIDENELKVIYRRLVKMCHPDVLPDRNSAEYFNLISQAYTEKNMAELVRLERIFQYKENSEQETLQEKLERLQAEYDSVVISLDEVKLKKHRMMNSPGYLLQQKFSWAELCGRNLTAEVINDALKQIKDKKRTLMQLRTEYAYLLQETGSRKVEDSTAS